MSSKKHWEAVYAGKRQDEFSWYQADPRLSIDLVRATGEAQGARILDVGGGASVLVDRLMEEGFQNIGVLDISPAALRASRERLGAASVGIEWVEVDILQYRTAHPWDIWHDRAVFHFLVDPQDRARYRESLYHSVSPGGHVIVATFAPEGPCRCSGLETLRCSAEELGDGVRLVEARTEDHRTPSGVEQPFVYARMVRLEATA